MIGSERGTGAVSEYVVREATTADRRAILDIYNDAVLHSTATFDLEVRSWREQQQWFVAHRSPYQVLVAAIGDTVAGWGSISRFRTRPAYGFTAEDSIYVHEDFRRRGIGAALLDALIQSARERGFHSIMALIDGDSTVSIHLHERFGFREVGTFREVGFKFGRWLDVVHMQKMLS
jgi:L-amino acid N-acyltransferase YncA